MAAIHFDIHPLVKTPQDSGFEQKQAEAVATAFREAQDQSEPITRQDINKLEIELREVKMDIKGLDTEIKSLEKGLKSDMQALEYRMTLKLGAMMAASITLVAAIIKLMDNA